MEKQEVASFINEYFINVGKNSYTPKKTTTDLVDSMAERDDTATQTNQSADPVLIQRIDIDSIKCQMMMH